MRRSEIIARLNGLRYEIEKHHKGLKDVSLYDRFKMDLEVVEECLYYFMAHEDADPHA